MRNRLIESKNLFSQSDLENWRRDCPSLLEIDVPDKGYIYRQGDRCPAIFWIGSGVIKLSRLTEQGNEITLALLRGGEFFGCFHASRGRHEMEEEAQAVGNARVYRIKHNECKTLLSRQPDLSWRLIEMLSLRNQRAERKLHSVLSQTVEMRLVKTLNELADLFGIRCAHGYALEIRLTQQDLADLVGANRSVVSTVMNALRRQGMLDYTRELICVNDIALSDLYAAE